MKVTAITRFKQGDLYLIIMRLGLTQKALADRAGMSTGTLGDIINLKRRPSVAHAEKIQRALGEMGEYLDILSVWPEAFQGIRGPTRLIQTQEIAPESLEDHREVLQIADAEPDSFSNIDPQMIEQLFDALTPREALILRKYFIDEMTFRALAKEVNLSVPRIEQILRKSLYKLRNWFNVERLHTKFPENPIIERLWEEAERYRILSARSQAECRRRDEEEEAERREEEEAEREYQAHPRHPQTHRSRH